MRLNDFGESIVFDAFPMAYNPQQIIILTHLLHLEQQILPKRLPKVYSTKILLDQFMKYCKLKNYAGVTEEDLIYVEPYQPIDIVIRKRKLKFLFCESEQNTHNLMILISEDDKITHLYAGNFVDIRTALLKSICATWLKSGVERLHVNLKRSYEDRKEIDVALATQAIQYITDIVEYHKGNCILFLPLFGYEHFISNLVSEFRKRISLIGELKEFYTNLMADKADLLDLFADDIEDTVLWIRDGTTNIHDAKRHFEEKGQRAIQMKDQRERCQAFELSANTVYYEVFFTPEPSPCELHSTAVLCSPQHIYGIIDKFNIASVVPKFLQQQRIGNKSEIEPTDDHLITTSKSSSAARAAVFVTSNSNSRSYMPTVTHPAVRKQVFPFLNESDSDEEDDIY